jgi:hypothetical protein
VAGFGFRTIGRLVSQYTSINPRDQPTSLNHFQSLTSLPIVLKPKPATVRLVMVDRGGSGWLIEVDEVVDLQDNRQAGQSIHLDPLPRSPTTSLTVAGFGFRTITVRLEVVDRG